MLSEYAIRHLAIRRGADGHDRLVSEPEGAGLALAQTAVRAEGVPVAVRGVPRVIGADRAAAGRLERYKALCATAVAPHPHLLVGERLGLFGFNPVFLDEVRELALIGEPVGWSRKYFAFYVTSVYGVQAMAVAGRLDLDIDFGAAVTVEAPMAILDAPGTEAYGHWILDTLPRLYSNRVALAEHRLSCRHVAPWCLAFLDAMGFGAERVHRRDPAVLTRYVRPVLPGFVKAGFVANGAVCRDAWLVARHRLLHGRSGGGVGGRVFVSRRDHADKDVGAAGAIEAACAAMGYAVVHPQTMSVGEQASVFAGARIVVGVDGSGLHNVVFCRPGAVVVVITTAERTNFWHLAVCHALDHVCCYWDVGAADDAAATVARLTRWLRRVEQTPLWLE